MSQSKPVELSADEQWARYDFGRPIDCPICKGTGIAQ
jgi:hypothetical protein